MNQSLANARKTHDDLTSEIASLSSRKETLAANRKEAFDRREAIRSDRVKATVEGTDFADDGELNAGVGGARPGLVQDDVRAGRNEDVVARPRQAAQSDLVGHRA